MGFLLKLVGKKIKAHSDVTLVNLGTLQIGDKIGSNLSGKLKLNFTLLGGKRFHKGQKRRLRPVIMP